MRIFVSHDHRLSPRRNIALSRAISVQCLTKHLLCLLDRRHSTFGPVMRSKFEAISDLPRLACLQYLVDKQA